MKRIILLGLVLVAIIVGSCTTGKISKSDPMTTILPMGDTLKMYEGTLVYALPKTLLDIEVVVERKVQVAGPYASYAKEMLGITDAIKSNSEEWVILEIRVKEWEEPDPKQVYVINSSALMHSNALQMREWGIIVDPLLTGKLVSGSNLAGESVVAGFETRDLGSDRYYNIVRDTTYRVVTVDSGFVRIPYLVERKVQLNTEQQADRAARTLLELREGKHLILTGEATVFPQSSAALDEINRLDNEYTALFTGKKYSEVKSYNFTIVPESEMLSSPVVVCRFSSQQGVLPITGSTGSELALRLNINEDDRLINYVTRPVDNKAGTKIPGLFYRMPQVTELSIGTGSKTLLSGRLMIYQYGTVIQLPSNYIIGR